MFNIFTRQAKTSSAATAKERLQILLAHERVAGSEANPDFLANLQRDILEVVRRHLSVEDDKVEIKYDRNQDISNLEISIDIPPNAELKTA